MNMPDTTAAPPRPVQAGLPLARALSHGDLESAGACFLRDGCLITPDATAIHGRDWIRPVLAQLIAPPIEIEIELSDLIRAGGTVFAYERWKVSYAAVGRPRVTRTWSPTLVLRSTDANWGLAIAALWGWGRSRG